MKYFLSVRDRRDDRLRIVGRDGRDRRVQRAPEGRGPLGLRRGLGAPGTATVIDNRNNQAVFTDGPFVESKECLAGFWVIEAPDLDVALKLAADGSKACNRKVEVRPFL